MNLQVLIEEIKKQYETDKSDRIFLVGIDGRSGSGKTTLANKIKDALSNSSIVHLDTFDLYQGKQNIQKVITEVLGPLKTKNERQIVILEGVFALHSDLENYYDYKVWVECPEETGYKRGLERDIKLNGINNSDKWVGVWLPKEKEYIKQYHPQEKADFIINSQVL